MAKSSSDSKGRGQNKSAKGEGLSEFAQQAERLRQEIRAQSLAAPVALAKDKKTESIGGGEQGGATLKIEKPIGREVSEIQQKILDLKQTLRESGGWSDRALASRVNEGITEQIGDLVKKLNNMER